MNEGGVGWVILGPFKPGRPEEWTSDVAKQDEAAPQELKAATSHRVPTDIERSHRFLEEALEIVQSLGCTASEAHHIVDYVFAALNQDGGSNVD